MRGSLTSEEALLRGLPGSACIPGRVWFTPLPDAE